METHRATTPFGRRPLTLGHIASQMAARAVPEGTVVHKWHVFQHIREARDSIGASDRSLAILNALLSFHPETALDGGSDLVVFPSNEQLINRANGMSPATLRRHLAVLVACGLILRRDSPNGKRFARKGQSGAIEQAFGFDLAPIVARAEEFKHLAEQVQAERKALRLVRERLTIRRRDIVKMIETAVGEDVPGDWSGLLVRYQGLTSRMPRAAGRQALEVFAEEFDALWTVARQALETFVNSNNMNGNESQTEQHIQNSKPNLLNELQQAEIESVSGRAENAGNVRQLPRRELPLGIVLDACPNMRWLAKDPNIRNWQDLLEVAEGARKSLGISPSAWADAREAMGDQQAAITVAAIFQRSEAIASPGGYLRSLSQRAREGQFSAWPMIMALLRAKLDGLPQVRSG